MLSFWYHHPFVHSVVMLNAIKLSVLVPKEQEDMNIFIIS
jgi:hypothetical protein